MHSLDVRIRCMRDGVKVPLFDNWYNNYRELSQDDKKTYEIVGYRLVYPSWAVLDYAPSVLHAIYGADWNNMFCWCTPDSRCTGCPLYCLLYNRHKGKPRRWLSQYPSQKEFFVFGEGLDHNKLGKFLAGDKFNCKK